MDADPQAWAATAVLELGRPQFHATLLTGLREAVRADHVTQLSYDAEGRLRQAFAASLVNQRLIESTTDIYVNHSFYRRDPNYGLLQDLASQCRQAQGVQLMNIAADSIDDSEYRRVLFQEPGFAAKIAMIAVTATGMNYLNLYFSTAPAMGVLELLHSRRTLLSALAQRHEQITTAQPMAAPGWTQGLSLRERQVAELLHQGHTAKEIGKQLALSPATVVTYKSRVFEKSGVKSLKEFLTRSAGWFH